MAITDEKEVKWFTDSSEKALQNIDVLGAGDINWIEDIKYEKILWKAIEVKDNNFFAPSIIYLILQNYEYINQKIYQETIEAIFSNKKLAKSGIRGNSFLYYLLQNNKLKLTLEQKDFVKKEIEESFVIHTNPITYVKSFLDIRYLFLINQNITTEEKAYIINKYYNDSEFDELISCLEQKVYEYLDELATNIKKVNINKVSLRRLTRRLGEDSAIKLIKQIELIRLIKKLRHIPNEKRRTLKKEQ